MQTRTTKKYSKENGWYKFFNDDKMSCRIKVDGRVNNSSILLKFKQVGSSKWNYYSPNRIFKNELHVAQYLCKNLENDKMLFKIVTQKPL